MGTKEGKKSKGKSRKEKVAKRKSNINITRKG